MVCDDHVVGQDVRIDKIMKNLLRNRNKYYDVTLYSSFLYLILAMIISRHDELLATFILLVFLTSIFYHAYPRNIYFRIADWIASLSLIFYLSQLVFFNLNAYSYLSVFLFLLLLLAIISFITSLVAHKEKSIIVYNFSHSL